MALSSSYSSPFLLLLLFAAAAIASSDDGGEKTTHLHYYLHANYGGPNTTTITVVSPPGNGSSSSSFGSIAVGDHMLKEGLDPSSTLIGKAEELAVQASLGSPAYVSAFNFVFTAGDYNGSSISIFGRAAPSDAAIERGVVGGSGMFRMARGYTISRVAKSTGPDDFLFVMEFDAYVFHY
ncbi:disease resistance response protein 206 [Musa troglodytarum]|uniref:Dirigent protein n=1 Tax=Musa troglodytarum TaxID=320322 RepID=A0A9E7KZ55_9LILI|nr:disease resistance response protein 206 [Musa troglodytarum]